MATTLMNDRIPCRYLIAKYVEDEVRDEPINVGVILQSNRDYRTIFKFITEYSNSKLKNMSNEDIVLFKEISSNIEETISSKNKEKNILDIIISKFEGKFRFTEPRGTLVSDLSNEIQHLFDRYIATKRSVDERNRITHDLITRDVSNFLIFLRYKSIHTHYKMHGKTSHVKYDVAILDKIKKYLHTTSFDEQRALKRVKLFDWSVKDTIEKYNELTSIHLLFMKKMIIHGRDILRNYYQKCQTKSYNSK